VQGHLECKPIELAASAECTSVLCAQPEEESSEAPSELDERGRAELQSQLSEMDDSEGHLVGDGTGNKNLHHGTLALNASTPTATNKPKGSFGRCLSESESL
jgi:hypothetical protein